MSVSDSGKKIKKRHGKPVPTPAPAPTPAPSRPTPAPTPSYTPASPPASPLSSIEDVGDLVDNVFQPASTDSKPFIQKVGPVAKTIQIDLVSSDDEKPGPSAIKHKQPSKAVRKFFGSKSEYFSERSSEDERERASLRDFLSEQLDMGVDKHFAHETGCPCNACIQVCI